MIIFYFNIFLFFCGFSLFNSTNQAWCFLFITGLAGDLFPLVFLIYYLTSFYFVLCIFNFFTVKFFSPSVKLVSQGSPFL